MTIDEGHELAYQYVNEEAGCSSIESDEKVVAGMFREEVSKGEARPGGQATGWWLQRRGGCEAVFNMETLTRALACGRCGTTWATAGSG